MRAVGHITYALRGFVEIILLVWLVPVVILLIGLPIAGAVKLALEIWQRL